MVARLAYLGLLVAALAGWFFMQMRHHPGRTMQQAAIWGLIFVGLVAGYGLWNDVSRQVLSRQEVMAGGQIVVPRGPDGHYHLTLQINGAPVDFVVDTGASDVVLSQSDAARVGLDLSSLTYLGSAQTANGIVRTAAVRLDQVELGGIVDRNLRAVVNEGQMDGSLLGMGYLGLFSHIEIRDGEMVLTR